MGADGSSGTPAPRRPRLADVAARVGLSPASVSLVLRGEPGPSEATRRRVQEAAEALGYRADRTASLLARRRSGLLGLLIDVHSPFHAELVEDVDAAAGRSGYDVVLSTLTRTRDETRAVDTLLDFRCEALVLLGPLAGEQRLAELDRTVPVVVVGRRLRPVVVDVVRSADDQGVAQLVDHLVDLGHERIAYVDGGRGVIAADRRRGYRTALRRRGLGERTDVVPGGPTEASGVAAAERLLRRGALPSAVVAYNDRAALGLLDALARAGVEVPGQVSVAGYDDTPLARSAAVDLTSVGQGAQQQAERAVAAVVDRLAGRRTGAAEFVLAPQLVVRGSTGAARAGSALDGVEVDGAEVGTA